MDLRRALGMLCALLFCLGTTACSTADALRVESPVAQASPGANSTDPANGDEQAWEQPFSPSQVRQLLLDTDLSVVSTQDNSAADIREYLAECDKCLVSLPSYETAGEKFQLYSISTAGDAYSFASFAIRNAGGTPKVALAVGGSDVYLSAGKEGSLVAQEAIYAPDDPMCCPSGWSVRMFRYQDGQFIQADSFSSPVDPSQDGDTDQ
ncbi:hypothetical protein [Glutamicibacter sp. NPDC087344]|uniref:hypothetical protein n=1 Tax=Glutamicibacter sp. NPDC087344 TaxID=3363994 RepID=UPI00382F956F